MTNKSKNKLTLTFDAGRELLKDMYAAFSGIPQKRVDLQWYVSKFDSVSSKGEIEPTCGTIACLAGWMGMHPDLSPRLGIKATSPNGVSAWLEPTTLMHDGYGEVVLGKIVAGYLFGSCRTQEMALTDGDDRVAALARILYVLTTLDIVEEDLKGWGWWSKEMTLDNPYFASSLVDEYYEARWARYAASVRRARVLDQRAGAKT